MFPPMGLLAYTLINTAKSFLLPFILESTWYILQVNIFAYFMVFEPLYPGLFCVMV